MNGSAALDTGSALPEVLIKRKKLLKLHTGGRRFLTQTSGEKGRVYVYEDYGNHGYPEKDSDLRLWDGRDGGSGRIILLYRRKGGEGW